MVMIVMTGTLKRCYGTILVQTSAAIRDNKENDRKPANVMLCSKRVTMRTNSRSAIHQTATLQLSA
jgi:hypothetical protein